MSSTADWTTAAEQTAAIGPAIEADHEITIARTGNSVFPSKPMPEMHVGQTVRYSSDAGAVTIEFPHCSPFRDDHEHGTRVPGSVILKLISAGEIESRCYVTLPDGTVLGWDKDHPEAGAGGKVSKP
jgi:hypothetical protein